MDRGEVIKWLKIMKANLNSFPEVSNAKKIEALAEAIRLLKNEQSENPTGLDDCISRAEVLKLMQDNWHTHNGDWAMQESMDDIRALPPVTPTCKKGKWLGDKRYPICPKCNCNIIEEYISCSDYAEMYKPMKFCPNCGADMRGEK